MAKYLASDAAVYVSTDGGSTYIDLSCQVSGYSGPGGSKEEIDTTTLCSTAREFIGGLPDYGSFELSGYWDPDATACSTLKDLYDDSSLTATANWKITFATPSVDWTFEGYVSAFSIAASAGAAQTFSATVRVSGAITEV